MKFKIGDDVLIHNLIAATIIRITLSDTGLIYVISSDLVRDLEVSEEHIQLA